MITLRDFVKTLALAPLVPLAVKLPKLKAAKPSSDELISRMISGSHEDSVDAISTYFASCTTKEADLPKHIFFNGEIIGPGYDVSEDTLHVLKYAYMQNKILNA